MQNSDFFHLFRNSLFRSKNHSSLSRKSKHISFWLSLLKKNLWKEGRFFDKTHGLSPLQNYDFFHLFRTSLFRSKNYSFLSRVSKHVSFWISLLKKNLWEKGRFFEKNHGLTPLQNFDFFHFFRTLLFRSKKHSFPTRV